MKTAAEIGERVLKRLAAQTAANRASGDRLRAEVRRVWESLRQIHFSQHRAVALIAAQQGQQRIILDIHKIAYAQP